MATRKSEKKGVLFIYEEDGREWTEHIMATLRRPEFSIPCSCVLSCFLHKERMLNNPVHVLILTPDMANLVDEIKDNLSHSCPETSLLVEYGADSKSIDMVNWTVRHKWEDSEGNYRILLSRIAELCKIAENDANYEVPDLVIVPTTFYPGQDEIHIQFINDQNCEIIVKMDGIKLASEKYTERFYVSHLPEKNPCGQKTISVYLKDETIPICTTTITIVTQDVILQNLIDNLKSVLRSELKSGENARLTAIAKMGIKFNPFLGSTNQELMEFADSVNQLYTTKTDVADRDSGFSDTNRYSDKRQGMYTSMQNLAKQSSKNEMRSKSFGVEEEGLYMSMNDLKKASQSTATPVKTQDKRQGMYTSMQNLAKQSPKNETRSKSFDVEEEQYMSMNDFKKALQSTATPLKTQDKRQGMYTSMQNLAKQSSKNEMRSKSFGVEEEGLYMSMNDLKKASQSTATPVKTQDKRQGMYTSMQNLAKPSSMIETRLKTFEEIRSDFELKVKLPETLNQLKSKRIVTKTAKMLDIPQLPPKK